MKRVQNGDRDAFAQLFERFHRPILAYVSALVGPGARAEELAQETFLRAYRARETYEPTARFSTWLWTIARNAAFDDRRRKRERLAGSETDEAAVALETLEDPVGDAESQLLSKLDRARLEKCLGELSEAQRQAVSLRIGSELPYDEIARVLELGLGAVKSLLHRAKLALTRCLA